ncbi:MAG: hypothetical protein AUJ56_10115 [Zetaproteobacteria bacterium CG1_02_49_23]|nr:MAG: hypothetical protein AUJ56_10115 [Zetaproteobacteria bacterium CG1_02_49_23]
MGFIGHGMPLHQHGNSIHLKSPQDFEKKLNQLTWLCEGTQHYLQYQKQQHLQLASVIVSAQVKGLWLDTFELIYLLKFA